MKKRNRLSRWLLRLYWKFTATVHKNAELEARRYAKYLNEHYTISEQLNIYKKLQQEFITIREEEIKNTVVEIVQKQEHQKYLEKNLENFKHLIPN